MQKWRKFLRDNLLTILTVVGVLSGTVVGCTLRSLSEEKWSKRESMYLMFPGEIFLRMLKGLIIPLLMSSITAAVGNLDLGLSKKIAFRTITYYLTTTFFAVVLGIFLVITIRPGAGAEGVSAGERQSSETKGLQRVVLTQDTMLDLIRNLFPENLMQACTEQYQTFIIKPESFSNRDAARANSSVTAKWDFRPEYQPPTNVLGLIFFSIILGISLGIMGEKGKSLVDLFTTLSEAMMLITSWVIWVSPIGVFFLVAGKMVESDSFWSQLQRLGFYFMTVMLGLFIHGFCTISVIFFVFTRRHPFKVFAQLTQVMAMAFGTASSSATIPISLQALDRMGVNPKISRFVIPVGATINMDGTALYEAVAAIFIAQLNEVPITFGQTVAICLTATAASVGAAGIPQAGLVTMVMVLDTVGLPADEIINILAVDWLLDRFRTTINVIGDCFGARLVDLLSAGEVEKMNEVDKQNADPHELITMTKDENI